jgi:hypothetical protein
MLSLLIIAGLFGVTFGVALGWACGRADGIHEGRAQARREHRRRNDDGAAVAELRCGAAAVDGHWS